MTNEQILNRAISKAKGYPYGCIMFPHILENKRYYSKIFSHDFAKAFAKYLLKEKAKFVSERVSPEYEEYETRLEICGERLHPFDGFYFEDEPEDMPIEDLLKDDRIVEDLKCWLLKQMVLEKEPLKYLEKFL